MMAELCNGCSSSREHNSSVKMEAKRDKTICQHFLTHTSLVKVLLGLLLSGLQYKHESKMNIFLKRTPLLPPLLTLKILICTRWVEIWLRPCNSAVFCHLHPRMNQESHVSLPALKELLLWGEPEEPSLSRRST